VQETPRPAPPTPGKPARKPDGETIRRESKAAELALAEAIPKMQTAARHMALAAAADTDDEKKQDRELQLLKEQLIDLHQQAVVMNTRLSDEPTSHDLQEQDSAADS
jgi:hypothetical protein